MIVRHVTRFPMRSGMTVTGIALSLGLLIATVQFIDSITLMIDSFFFRAQRQDVTLRFVEPRADPVRGEIERLPGVLRTELRRTVGVKLTHGPRSKRVVILGIDPDSELSQQVGADRRTIELPPAGLLLTRRLAEHLNVKPGDDVEVAVLEGRRARTTAQVTRVIDEYVGLAVYMQRAALNRLTGDGEVADSAWLKTDPAKDAALFAEVKQTPGLFTIQLQRQAYRMFRDLMDQNMMTMIWFYVGFASVIAFGVAYNASRITLSERAHELATLRVLGYHKREVALILVGELALLTLIALPIGCVLGYGMASLMMELFETDLYQIPLGLAPATYGWSALVIIAAAAVSAAVVVRRIQTLDLVRVLKGRD
jgi:putative ABC transport system permease protein